MERFSFVLVIGRLETWVRAVSPIASSKELERVNLPDARSLEHIETLGPGFELSLPPSLSMGLGDQVTPPPHFRKVGNIGKLLTKASNVGQGSGESAIKGSSVPCSLHKGKLR